MFRILQICLTCLSQYQLVNCPQYSTFDSLQRPKLVQDVLLFIKFSAPPQKNVHQKKCPPKHPFRFFLLDGVPITIGRACKQGAHVLWY